MNWLSKKIKDKSAYFVYKLNSWAESVILHKKQQEIKNLLLHCGKGVHFHGRIKIAFPENVRLDDNVIVGVFDEC